MASSFPDRMVTLSFAKRMSSQLAAALVAFALLQIVVVAKMGGSLPMHLGIVIAVAGFAVAARSMEHRWARLSASNLPEAGLARRFRVDRLQIWGATLLAPFLWIPVGIVGRFILG